MSSKIGKEASMRILSSALAILDQERVTLGLPAIDGDRVLQPASQLPIECGTLPCGGDETE